MINEELKNQRLGERRLMKCGAYCTIIEYNKYDDISVKFEDGTLIKNKTYSHFKKREINKGKKYYYGEIKNIIGNKYGKLEVISFSHKIKSNRQYGYIYYYNCKCECGNECIKSENYLNSTKIKSELSCGCATKLAHSKFGSVKDNFPNLEKIFKNKEDLEKSTWSHERAIVVCPICKREKELTIKYITSNNGFQCDSCRDGISYPEKFIRSILNQSGLFYETEKTFDWSKNKRYDFYIPSMSCIIETHGNQHYEECSLTKRTLKEEKENDAMKNNLAKNNGILIYIELDCRFSEYEYIKKSIQNSKLINIVDFEKIDFNRVLLETNDDILIEICNDWNNLKEHKLYDFSKRYNLDERTVSKYLKYGEKLGICKYSNLKKTRNKRNANIDGDKRFSKIRCIELDKSFNSMKDCIKYFEEELNIKLVRSAVSCVCSKRRNHYKGYHFEYINN